MTVVSTSGLYSRHNRNLQPHYKAECSLILSWICGTSDCLLCKVGMSFQRTDISYGVCYFTFINLIWLFIRIISPCSFFFHLLKFFFHLFYLLILIWQVTELYQDWLTFHEFNSKADCFSIILIANKTDKFPCSLSLNWRVGFRKDGLTLKDIRAKMCLMFLSRTHHFRIWNTLY